MNAITKNEVEAPVADPMIAMIERIVTSPELPIERMAAIMDLRERQMNKEAEQDFNRAFAAAMAEMPNVPRSGWNPHLKRNYSTLDDLIKTTRPVLARHGLSLNWQVRNDGVKIWVKAIVRHSGGHQISTEDDGDRDKSGSMNALQGGGSTQTYLKRYTGFAILGMASGDEADDDGASVGMGATISADQFVQLNEKIISTKADKAKFASHMGVQNLEELPASKFREAMSALDAKARQNGGGK